MTESINVKYIPRSNKFKGYTKTTQKTDFQYRDRGFQWMKRVRRGVSGAVRFWNMNQQKSVVQKELDLCILGF